MHRDTRVGGRSHACEAGVAGRKPTGATVGERHTIRTMRRLCGRPGCSAPATVTFTFDATARIVWLDDIVESTARAGDLCTRHAESMAPPRGWVRDDRRTRRMAALSTKHTLAAANVAHGEPRTGRTTTNAAAVDELLPHRVARREPRKRKKRDVRWSDVPTLFDENSEPTPPAGTESDPVTPPAPAPATVHATGVADSSPHGEAATIDLTTEVDAAHAAPDRSPAETGVERDDRSPTASWTPRYEVDDLGGLLDAKSPLLARAFRAAKATDDPSRSAPVDVDEPTDPADEGEIF